MEEKCIHSWVKYYLNRVGAVIMVDDKLDTWSALVDLGEADHRLMLVCLADLAQGCDEGFKGRSPGGVCIPALAH